MAYFYYQNIGGEESWKIISEEKIDSIETAMFRTVLSVDSMVQDGITREEASAIKYQGPLYFDLDDAESPGSTGKFAVELVEKLEGFDVNPEDLEIFASGGKGFHVLVPQAVFMPKVSKVGTPQLPAIYKEMAFQLAVQSMDFRVYTAKRGRMFRQADVLRSNGMYKTKITWQELKDIAFSDTSEADYEAVCKSTRRKLPFNAFPEKASGLMALFDQCKMKVQKAANKSKKAKRVTLPDNLPSFEMLLEGEGIAHDAGFHQLAMQIAITAHHSGMKLPDLLTKASGLCEKHESDSYRYNTPTKRLNEIERMWAYTEDNPCYEYSPGAIISLLSHQAPDLQGLQMTREEVEDNMGSEEVEDEDYSGVVMNRSGVYAILENGTKKVSNVSYENITVLRSVDTGLSSLVEADIYVNGVRQRRDTFSNETWQSSTTLNKASMSYGSSFLGSDNQARGIYLRINDKAMRNGKITFVTDREGIDWVKVPGTSEDPDRAGFFIWADNRTVVVPPAVENIRMVFKGYPETEGQFRTDLGDAPNLAEWVQQEGNKDVLENFLDNLLHCQNAATIGKYLGWTTACHFRMMFHMRYNQFPLLHVNGAAGQGKTSMMILFLNQHYYKSDPKVSSPSTTLFANTSAMAGSSSIPVVIDEFKPTDMPMATYDRYRAMFRDAYNCRDVARGGGSRDNNDYKALHRTRLAAPVCFIAEAVENEPALMERVILLTLVKPDTLKSQKFRDKYEAALGNRHILGILGRYIVSSIIHSYSLEQFDAEFKPILDAARYKMMLNKDDGNLAVDSIAYAMKSGMKDRTVFNYAVLQFGIRKFQSIVQAVLGDRYDSLFDEMIKYSTDSTVDLQKQTQPEWLKVLNHMVEMEQAEDYQIHALRINRDYAYVEYNGKPCIELNAMSVYLKYRAYCKLVMVKPLFPSTEAFAHALNNVPVCESSNYKGVVNGVGPNHLLEMEGMRILGFSPPNAG